MDTGCIHCKTGILTIMWSSLLRRYNTSLWNDKDLQLCPTKTVTHNIYIIWYNIYMYKHILLDHRCHHTNACHDVEESGMFCRKLRTQQIGQLTSHPYVHIACFLIENLSCKTYINPIKCTHAVYVISLILFVLLFLTHRGRVAHMCIDKLFHLWLDKVMASVQRQATIRSNENLP